MTETAVTTAVRGTLRVRVLGALDVDGVSERDLGSRKARTTLKVLALPSATLATRETQPRVVVGDADEFVPWATDTAPELLRVTVEPHAGEIAKVMAIAEALAYQDVVLTLACGHRPFVRYGREDLGHVPGIGDVWACEDCAAESETGEGPEEGYTTVSGVQIEEVSMPVGLYASELVPGVRVEPGRVTVTAHTTGG